MKSLVFLAIVPLLAACGCANLPAAETNPEMALAKQLQMGGGTCSGTPVSANTILTAAHCVDADNDGKVDPEKFDHMWVDGKKTEILNIISDGQDHALLVTRMTYDRWASFGSVPLVGDTVHLYGNPGGVEDLYRQGAYVGTSEGVHLYDINIWHGDSGAAILNKRGQIVGVVTGYWIDHNPMAGANFRLMVSLPLEFTAEQWKAAGVEVEAPKTASPKALYLGL